jgi:cysteinyl-tRNA synthetase
MRAATNSGARDYQANWRPALFPPPHLQSFHAWLWRGMTRTPLILYNSLSRTLERFEPIDAANVRVYSCGPTVYNYAHIGNLRAYVFTDTLTRVLAWKEYPLTHVINITDVGHLTSDADVGDDKMEAAAKATGQTIWDIAAHFTAAFKQNLADLNIRAPSRWALATDHIDEMIDFAAQIAPRHCYQLGSGLYFDVSTVPDYGRLARTQDDEREGRIDPVAGKRHPQDFAIWRTSQPGENRQMEWESPWGRGAPGWHLECSVMSKKYLGAHFDIHTGGIDHREIHHPNEIAQNQAHCECAETGANWWMHNNFLVDRSGKMSKSSGGFTTLQSLIDKGVHPLAYRLMCLSAHYRSELEFSGDNLAAAVTRMKRLVMTVSALRDRATGAEAPAVAASAYRQRLDEAVSDDLNTPRALPILDEMLADKRLSPAERLATLGDFDAVLGLDLTTTERSDLRLAPADASIAPDEIVALLAERREARAAKDFARSDSIRDKLAAADVEVMDGDPLGWDWRLNL